MRIKENVISCLNFLGVNIACAFFQLIVLLVLVALQVIKPLLKKQIDAHSN